MSELSFLIIVCKLDAVFAQSTRKFPLVVYQNWQFGRFFDTGGIFVDKTDRFASFEAVGTSVSLYCPMNM